MKLLDTSVLIDIDIGGKEVLEKAKELDKEGRHAICSVSHFEFYWGIYRNMKSAQQSIKKPLRKLKGCFRGFFLSQ